ncbi:MAG TPA: ABC transporter ATP-binding protein [Chthoniobacterales bacterium]|nr:ABC transporter ATP-binding protein [Chthoniobacterales bacterium]
MKKQSGAISIQSAGISFTTPHRTIEAVKDISVELRAGEFTTLLGPSGCGKSSLLGAIAGFVPLSRGQILVDERLVRKPDGSRGIVFQDHNLFPWRTVQENVEFGPKMRRIPKKERSRLTAQMLERVNLRGFEANYPDQLSGGMQQRVNLARVLVNRPDVLLLDEPFGALDAQTRLQMQEMLLQLWSEIHMTIAFVTHDIDEAILLSDRVIVMSQRPGQIRSDLEVSLPRPRTADQLTSIEFNRLKKQCLQLLRAEPSFVARPSVNGSAASTLQTEDQLRGKDSRNVRHTALCRKDKRRSFLR